MASQLRASRVPIIAIYLLLLGLFLVFFLHFFNTKAQAVNPNLMNFQGKVVNADGTNVANGNYDFNFILYDDPTAGTNRWQENWTTATSQVTVTNGIFQVNLGTHVALPNFNTYPNLYLAVRFNNDAAGYMTPRVRLTSVPYALNSDTLGGLTSGGFVQNQNSGQQATSNFWISGTGRADSSMHAPVFDTATSVALGIGSSSATAITIGNVTNSTIAVKAKADAAAFQVQDSAGASLFNADSTTRSVSGGNIIKVGNSTGTDTATTIFIVDHATAVPTSNLSVLSGGLFYNSTTNKLSVIENGTVKVLCNETDAGCGAGGATTLQTAYNNDSSGEADIVTTSASKTILIKAGAGFDSPSLFQIQNSSAASIANISTISFNQNLLANPSFESNTAGWSGYGAGGVDTLTTTTTAAAIQSGSQGLQDVTTATANRGVKYLYVFKPNTTYTFSIYAAVSSGTTGAFFDIGRYENNVAITTSCPVTQTLTTTLTRFTCTFTTGATINGATDGPFARYTDATNVYTFYFDAAQLEQAGSVTSFIDQVYPNIAPNPSFETGTNSWVAKGSATISASDDFANLGKRSLKIVTTGGVSDGATGYVSLESNSRYTLNFSARSSSGTYNITPGRQDSGSDSDCSAVSVTTSWANYSCSFTTGTVITYSYQNIYFKDAVAHTTYIDGVSLTANNAGQQYVQIANSLQADPLYGSVSLNNSNVAELQPWQLTTDMASRYQHSSVTANGYVYVLGGAQNNSSYIPKNNVYYAKLNADGSTGAWQLDTNTLPVAAADGGIVLGSSVVANGYVYYIGGVLDLGTIKSTVYYAKLNADGSTGAWQTSANALPTGRRSHTSVAANGYVYVLGGYNSTYQSTVYYAKLNADGSTGAWQTSANALPAIRGNHSSIVSNGYAYVIGGTDGARQSTVYYAKLNADGSTGAWQTSAALPDIREGHTSAVLNGYVYVMGGTNGARQSTVYYAKLNANGSTGAWQTNTNALGKPRVQAASVVNNGYIYVLGGETASSQAALNGYYTTANRVTIGGSLDLVSAIGQTPLNEAGSNGGNLTAGDTKVQGLLDVRDQANFSGSVGIGGTLSVAGGASIKGAGGSINILQVQNAGSINLINVNTINLVANSNFEVGQTNLDNSVESWSKKLGSETSIKNQTTAPQYGSRSMEIVTTTTAQQGVKTVVPLIASTQYTLSFYAKVSTGSFATLTFGRSDTGSGETDCVTTGSITTTYARFTCTFTTGAGVVGGSYVYISKGTDTTARTIYIDGVQLEAAGAATDYRNADISVDSLATFKSTVNSTAAFQIQDSSGSRLLTVDTINSALTLEGGTGATAIQIGNGPTAHGIQIGSNATGANAIVIGGVHASSTLLFEAGTAATAIQIGNGATAHGIQIGTGAAVQTIVIGSTNSTSATTIQGGSGNISLLTSTGNKVQIGSSSTDANYTLFVLDSYNTTDPTGINGAMYYSTSTNTFRCYENSAWLDCVSKTQVARVSSSVAVTGQTFGDVTGLSFSLAANTNYQFDCRLHASSSATTNGIRVGVNGPATPTRFTVSIQVPTSTTASSTLHTSAYDTSPATTASAGTTQVVMDVVGIIEVGSTAGTLQMRLANEVAGGTATVYPGSTCKLT